MFEVGDEVITCDLSFIPTRNGIHLHDDSCFEVRLVYGPKLVSDAFLGSRVVASLTAAPMSLLGRKHTFYTRLTKIVEHWEIKEQNSSGALLDRLVQELDRYLFCDESALRIWRTNDPGSRSARLALDGAARYLFEHRRDHGLGRDRYKILQDVIGQLNAGPVVNKLTF